MDSSIMTQEAHGPLASLRVLDITMSAAHLDPTTFPEGDRAFLEIVRKATATIGRDVLSAATPAELSERVDAALCAPELRDIARLAVTVSWGLIEKAARPLTSPRPSILRVVLGDRPAQRLEEAERIAVAHASVMLQFFTMPNARTARAQVATAAIDSAYDLLGFVTDETIPVPVRECLLQGCRGSVYAIAIAHAIELRGRMLDWRATMLVESLIAALRDALRPFASLPGISVPEDIIPEDQRFDIAALEAEQAAANARIDTWARIAEASGEDAYFPADDVLFPHE